MRASRAGGDIADPDGTPGGQDQAVADPGGPLDELQSLRRSVQRNCDISDAEFAQSYSLCTYLLKMRELYRWERV